MDNLNIICQFCGKYYSKNRKPKIMQCTHNACELCLQINNEFLICFECNKVYKKKDIRKFPINFLLLEISSSIKKDETNIEFISKEEDRVFHCNECNMDFNTNFHLLHNPNHKGEYKSIMVYKDKITQIKKTSQNLIQQYHEFNKQLQQEHEKFIDTIFNCIQKNNDINLDKYNTFTLLRYCGIINPADEKRLIEFYNKIVNNKTYSSILKQSNNFNEIDNALDTVDPKSVDFISKDQFYSLLFYFYDIYNKKLSHINDKFDELNNKLQNDIEYTRSFIQNLSFNIYYNSQNFYYSYNYKISFIFIPNTNIFISFEPINKTINKNILNFPFEGLPKSYTVTSNGILYLISNDNKIYYMDIINNQISQLQTPNSFYNIKDKDINATLIFHENILYMLSSNSFERVYINNEFKTNQWQPLSYCEEQIRKPLFVHSCMGMIEVIDLNRKSFDQYYTYSPNKKKWKKHKMRLNELDILALELFALEFNEKIYYIGGKNVLTNQINQNLYEIDYYKNIKRIDKIQLHINNTDIIYIDFATNLDDIYLIVCYRQIDSESDVIVRVWNKKFKEEKMVLFKEETITLK